jgi:hypothetical protein
VPFPNGAAAVVDRAAWILLADDADPSLGAALAWSLGRGATSLDLVAESGTGLLARRAEWFDFPIRVRFSSDRALLPALAEPLVPPPTARQEHLDFRGLIESAGAEPVVEHGIVTGEVRGLEVCRVVDQPTTGNLIDAIEAGYAESPRTEGLQLEVGVGAADREAFQLIHGDVPTVDALADVVRSVTAHRSGDAPQHPLNRLARERFLRWRALSDPSIVGLASLGPAEPPVQRMSLKDPTPCVAAGLAADGRPATVVFSSGVDLDLMPFAADAAAVPAGPPCDDLVVALPGRDLLPVTERLAALLARPVRFVRID